MNNIKGLILVHIGVALILLSLGLQGYNGYINKQAGIKSEKIYKQIQETMLKVDNKGVESKILDIDGNKYIGIISIPTLGLELPIMNDWDNEKMKYAPCRYYGSLETNDLILCSHSYDNLLGNIKDLKQKDIVVITSISGKKYIYEVEVIEVLQPDDVVEMIENEFDLTLYTCTKDNLNRVTVRLNIIKEN